MCSSKKLEFVCITTELCFDCYSLVWDYFPFNKVVYWGQPIGAVVAESREQATHAAEKVRIQYEEMPPVLTIEVSFLFIN